MSEDDKVDEINRMKVEVLTDCLEVAHQEEGPSSTVYSRIKDRLEDAKAALAGRKVQSSALSHVAELEERFSENQDDENLRRELHVARIKAGWSEFKIDAASDSDPRLVIPWVAVREVTWAEEWNEKAYGRKTPDAWWLKTSGSVGERGKMKKISNPHVCDDGKWRRDVTEELDVVAVEDLAHLRSIVTRMNDFVIYRPDATGLMTLTIFDQSG